MFIRLTIVLGLVAALASACLAFTYAGTKEKIAEQEEALKIAALNKIFFNGFDRTEEITKQVTAVYVGENDTKPSFYAVQGNGIGYNTGKPISLMVGFTNPAMNLPEQKGKTDYVIYGWRVIDSEETPGLGEKAKDEVAPYTWAEKLTGTAKDPGPDRATAFQKQFRGLAADELKLKKDGGSVDTITAATYTTLGVVRAIQDARRVLGESIPGGAKDSK